MGLQQYPGQLFGMTYPSAEMQSVHSVDPANRAKFLIQYANE